MMRSVNRPALVLLLVVAAVLVCYYRDISEQLWAFTQGESQNAGQTTAVKALIEALNDAAVKDRLRIEVE